MKNLIVSIALVLTTGAAPVLAHATNNDPRIEKAFAQQFTGAQNVKWSAAAEGYQHVIFTLNGSNIEAFYDQDAELVGTIRMLTYNQLPLRIMQTLDSRFAGAVVAQIKEIMTVEGTSYKILLEQKGKKYSVKIGSLGDVQEKEKIKIN